MGEQKTTASSVNRAKTYQLVLFPLNNGATNVYYVLVLSYIATFGSKVLALSMLFASVMVTGMRLFDAVTDPIIGALMDRTNGRFGKFRPFMVIGNLIMQQAFWCCTASPRSSRQCHGAALRCVRCLYAVWVIGYTFQTSCTRSGQTVLTNDPKQRPLFTIFNTVGSLLGMGAMQFFAPILAKNYEAATLPPGSSARWLRWASSSPSCSLCWLSSASGRRISPSTLASAAKRPRRSRCASISRSSKTTIPCSG